MVQLWNLPAPVDTGAALGRGLGSGLAKGMERGSEVGFQRGMIQSALEGLDKLPAGTSPLDATKYLLQATAGLPDQGRIMQALAPYLIGGARAGAAFGPGGLGGSQSAPGQGEVPPEARPRQPVPEAGGQAAMAEGVPSQEPGKPQGARPSTKEPQFGGFFQRPKTPQEINAYSAKYAQLFPEDPGAYIRGQQIAQEENKVVQKSWDNFTQNAIAQNPDLSKRPERIPVYNQILQKYGDLQDPNEIMRQANAEYGEVSNLLDSLNQAYVPGVVKGTLKKLPVGGITGAFMAGGDTRDKTIKQLQPTVQDLVKRGFEPQVRSQLVQQQSLSPTEVEELVHPLSEKNLQSLKSLPEASKVPEKDRAEKLSKFFKDNVTPDTSLLALRHRLWDEKGYDWQEIGPALQAAGVPLDTRQTREQLIVNNDPPIQSMSDIFRGWGRWIDFLRGSK